MADGKVQIWEGSVLTDSGKVAVDDDCCCVLHDCGGIVPIQGFIYVCDDAPDEWTTDLGALNGYETDPLGRACDGFCEALGGEYTLAFTGSGPEDSCNWGITITETCTDNGNSWETIFRIALQLEVSDGGPWRYYATLTIESELVGAPLNFCAGENATYATDWTTSEDCRYFIDAGTGKMTLTKTWEGGSPPANECCEFDYPATLDFWP